MKVINEKRKLFFIPDLILVFICAGLIHAQTERWVYTYDGPADSTDEAYSIVFGEDGNIYVGGSSRGIGTGRDFTVISLTTPGDTNWVYRYIDAGCCNSIVYGLDENIYAAGDGGFTVISLTTSGDTNWVYRYGSGAVNSIVYGLDGNLYAAGYDYYFDFTVISLDTTGTVRWVYTYNGPGGAEDEAYSIVYGLDGNIYAAGYSNMSQEPFFMNWDFTVISLDTTGNERWVYTIYYPDMPTWDEANSIVYGLDGNIYAAGYRSWDYFDFTMVSLTTDGDTNWVYTYDGQASGNDEAYSIVYGLDGNIYAAGKSTGIGTDRDFTVISLTTTGDTNWVYTYNGPGNGPDAANSIVYGLDGNIYAAGYNEGMGTSADFTVINLTTAGDVNWVYTYNGSGNSDDAASSIVYGVDGNLYVAGYSTGNGTGCDFTVVSLGTVSSIEDDVSTSGPTVCLLQNIPNPFIRGKGTTITYSIHERTNVVLSVYTSLGQRVRTLVNKPQQKGIYKIFWDGRSDSGEYVASGVYFYRLRAGDFVRTKKILVIR